MFLTNWNILIFEPKVFLKTRARMINFKKIMPITDAKLLLENVLLKLFSLSAKIQKKISKILITET